MDWFRSWHGAPTDPKWLLIAKRSETQAGVVSAIVWALFDFASQNSSDRGCVEDFDAETYAAFSGFEEATIKRVIECLEEKKLIIDGHLAAWEKRQTKREDNSTPRVQKHRNAMKRNVTPETAREEKIREEKIIKEEVKKEEPREVALSFDPNEITIFWEAWPNKVGKPAAVKALASARKRGAAFGAIMDGVRNYIRDKPPDRPWLNPATFLNQNRWEDQPAQVAHGPTQTNSLTASIRRELAELERSEGAGFALPASGFLRLSG
jgi:FMN phosphatase YigB (HAD superfamily)